MILVALCLAYAFTMARCEVCTACFEMIPCPPCSTDGTDITVVSEFRFLPPDCENTGDPPVRNCGGISRLCNKLARCDGVRPTPVADPWGWTTTWTTGVGIDETPAPETPTPLITTNSNGPPRTSGPSTTAAATSFPTTTTTTATVSSAETTGNSVAPRLSLPIFPSSLFLVLPTLICRRKKATRVSPPCDRCELVDSDHRHVSRPES